MARITPRDKDCRKTICAEGTEDVGSLKEQVIVCMCNYRDCAALAVEDLSCGCSGEKKDEGEQVWESSCQRHWEWDVQKL